MKTKKLFFQSQLCFFFFRVKLGREKAKLARRKRLFVLYSIFLVTFPLWFYFFLCFQGDPLPYLWLIMWIPLQRQARSLLFSVMSFFFFFLTGKKKKIQKRLPLVFFGEKFILEWFSCCSFFYFFCIFFFLLFFSFFLYFFFWEKFCVWVGFFF